MQESLAKALIKKTEEDYNKIADYFSETRSRPWPEFGLFKNYLKPGDKVLDAGCGNGRLYEFLEKINIDYTGLDLSVKLIEIARKLNPDAKFMVGDIMKMDFPENEFDAVFINAVLQHIPGRAFRVKALENIEWILKPGGYLFMTNWNLWQSRFRPLIIKSYILKIVGNNEYDFRDIFVPWKDQRGELITERYVHAFKKEEIEELLKLSRLQLETNFYFKEGAEATRGTAHNIVTVARKP